MASAVKGVDVLLRDVGELSELNEELPRKWGIPPSPVQLQCVASSKDLVVIGTTHSLVIVHHFRTMVTDKISLEGPLKRTGVTAIAMIPEAHNRTAIGRQSGLINIYQFSDSEAFKRRSLIKKLHSAPIVCLEWDTRGALLFSGDESGKVFATEIDMRQGKHHSWLVYDCAGTIVQLSYAAMTLLVSSTANSVLCRIARDITLTNPAKIGSKDRKAGEYGGCFAVTAKGEDVSIVVYVSRPGLRVWRADCDGKVLATLKFKDLFEGGNIPAIKIEGRKREASQASASGSEVQQLGRLLTACGQFLLAWQADSLWLLEPETGRIVGYAAGVGEILDLSIYRGWLVVLREPPYARQSPIIRLAFDPTVVPPGNSPVITPRFRNVGDASSLKPSLDSIVAKSPTDDSVQAMVSPEPQVNSDEKTEDLVKPMAASQPAAQAESSAEPSLATPADSPTMGLAVQTVDKSTFAQGPAADAVLDSAFGSASAASAASDTNQSTAMDAGEVAVGDQQMCPSPMLPARCVSPPLACGSSPDRAVTAASSLVSSSAGDGNVSVAVQGTSAPVQGASTPMSERQSLPPTANQITEVVRSTQPMAYSRSSPALRHTADSKMPFVPPQFDINLDEADTSVVIRPKGLTKRKTKKGKKDTATTSSGSVPLAGVPLASAIRKTVSATAVVPEDTSGTPVSDSASYQVSEQLKLTPGDGAAAPSTPAINDQLSPTCESHSDEALPQSRSVVEEEAGEVQIDASASKPSEEGDAVEAVASREDDEDHVHSVNDCVPSLTVVGEDAPSAPVVAAAEETRSLEPAASVELPSTAPTLFKEDVAEDVINCKPDELGPSSVSDDISNHAGVALKKNSQPSIAVSHAQQASGDCEAAYGDSAAASGGAGLEDSGQSSDANSVTHSGEQITSIYDMEPIKPEDEDEGDDEAVVASDDTATTAAAAERGIFVPSDAKVAAATASSRMARSAQPEAGSATEDLSLTDSWVQCPSPCRHPISSLVCTPTHIWAIDSKDTVYTWSLGKRRWLTLKGSMRYISASPSGDIVWGFSKSGSLYHRAGIERKVRAGVDWRKMDMKVKSIAVDNKRSWVLTANGGVRLRRDVSLAVPTGQQWEAIPDVPNNLRYLAAGNRVLWAITTDNVVLARVDISQHKPLGTGWEMVCPGHQFQDVAIGINGTGWFVNMDGVVCFMNNVSLASPLGDGRLWLSSLGQFVVHDASLLEALWTWSLVKKNDPVRCVSASMNCVAVLNSGSGLLFSAGKMIGSWYMSMSLPGIAPSTTWISVSASCVHAGEGHVWMLQRSGEVFCVQEGERPVVVEAPGRHQLVQISASLGSIWVVSSEGSILERKEVSVFCPTGTAWQDVPVTPLKNGKVKHISCGLHSAWAVDDRGQAWMKVSELGQKVTCASGQWQPVDSPQASTKFTQVVVGPGGWHVWAVDTAGCTYARLDVGIDTPLGSRWQSVGGVHASKLCISNVRVWCCCASGDLVWRSSVTPRNPTGDYWKRIPGTFSDVSVTPDDVLWLIDPQGFLFRRETCVYTGSTSKPASKLAAAGGSSLDTWVVL